MKFFSTLVMTIVGVGAFHCSSPPTEAEQAAACEQTSASACEDAGCRLVQWTAVANGEACQLEAAPTAMCVFFPTTDGFVKNAVSVVVEDTDTNPRVFEAGNGYDPPPVGWRNCQTEGDDVAGCHCNNDWTEVGEQ